ncbi:hypothetical protein Tco_1469609 [Tanacetum coccineum]
MLQRSADPGSATGDAEVQSQKVYAVKKQHNKEKGEDNFVDEQTDAEENTEKQERNDGRKRRVKAASIKRVEKRKIARKWRRGGYDNTNNEEDYDEGFLESYDKDKVDLAYDQESDPKCPF